MMRQGILDDIRNDEFKKNAQYKRGFHTKNEDIKEKLNIWFSLYNFFTNTNKSKP
ncbi:hypothetical protein ACE193_25025 [Bernardetia sp. OM2101]|uniref:hypothetical protein n=1 Tax=Bernardetia sp. OM2101 TaxID=3344876 RepID=UPI0035CF026C